MESTLSMYNFNKSLDIRVKDGNLITNSDWVRTVYIVFSFYYYRPESSTSCYIRKPLRMNFVSIRMNLTT